MLPNDLPNNNTKIYDQKAMTFCFPMSLLSNFSVLIVAVVKILCFSTPIFSILSIFKCHSDQIYPFSTSVKCKNSFYCHYIVCGGILHFKIISFQYKEIFLYICPRGGGGQWRGSYVFPGVAKSIFASYLYIVFI